jgi:UDP-GlcNAc:undecaprenyl-phosphate GlcNAc-1-phosphate transferase
VTYFGAFVLSFAAAASATPLVRHLARRWGWVDAPEGRKVHQVPVPRVGGLAIAFAYFLPFAAVLLLDNPIQDAVAARPKEMAGLVIGGFGIVLLGLWDDLKGLGAARKFAVQIAVASLCWWAFDLRIERIANPFGDPFELGMFGLPVSILWFVAVVNAVNLIDGLDGLASGVALIAALTLFMLALMWPNPVAGLSAIALCGALLGFLLYNFNPASIFMGDSGSLFLGFILASTGIIGSTKSRTLVALLVPVIALGVPFADTALAVVRRLLAGRSPFAADRGHVHHRLLALGYSHRRAVLILYAACVACAVVALALVHANGTQAGVLLALWLAIALVGARATGLVDWARMRRSARFGLLRAPRLASHLAGAELAGAAIQRSGTPEEALDALLQWARTSDLNEVDCRLVVISHSGSRMYEARWTRRSEDTVSDARVVDIELDWALGDVRCQGAVAFRWAAQQSELSLPERPVYEWLALRLRDRVLETSQHTGPRVVRARADG